MKDGRSLKENMAAKYLLIFLIITWLGPVQAREQLKEMFQRRKELDSAKVIGGFIKTVPSEVRNFRLYLKGKCTIMII